MNECLDVQDYVIKPIFTAVYRMKQLSYIQLYKDRNRLSPHSNLMVSPLPPFLSFWWFDYSTSVSACDNFIYFYPGLTGCQTWMVFLPKARYVKILGHGLTTFTSNWIPSLISPNPVYWLPYPHWYSDKTHIYFSTTINLPKLKYWGKFRRLRRRVLSKCMMFWFPEGVCFIPVLVQHSVGSGGK